MVQTGNKKARQGREVRMRTFKNFNPKGEPCPVCKTKDNKETILLAIDGTNDGQVERAMQMHADCIIALRIDRTGSFIYMRLPKKMDMRRLV